MSVSRPPEPFPADPIGQQLCEIFGRYRWHCIQAAMPDDVTAKVAWQTITQYPLRPRALWSLWQDAHTLIGVRFTHETRYALLDIDAGSDYSSPGGIAQIRAALETVGIARTLLIRSSWNGGLHLYVPLPELVNTFNLAVALKECLKAQGFRLQAGQLEIFPNVKAYGVQTVIEYHAHRLPLQPGSGSCLLDDDLNPAGTSLARFFWLWDHCASHQDLDSLHHAFKIGRDNHRKRPRRQSHPVDSWRQDLDIEITEGWTAHGQTNHLLKTMACYGRVFEGLQGQALIDYVVRLATSRPGYGQYCRHQGDIQRKAAAWAQAAEHYYWPLGSLPIRTAEPRQNNLVAFNRQQAEDAQQRIRRAYAQLAQTHDLPDQITARAKAIARTAQVSQQTLYKNRDLWHPQHQGEINHSISVSGSEPDPAPRPEESLEPLEIKELHPKKKIMKGGAPSDPDLGLDFTLLPSNGGGRGDDARFPQGEDGSDLDGSSGPVPTLDELMGMIQRQVQRLQWDAAQMQQLMADRFGGRRRSQLRDDELLLLLYYLMDGVVGGHFKVDGSCEPET